MSDALRTISIAWSLIHILIMFIFLYESRFTFRKTLLITLATMGPLMIANVVLYIILGKVVMGQYLILTIVLPSLVFFFFMSKYRDGRFAFTFCIVDTVSLDIIILTALIDKYLMGDLCIFMLVSRLLAFPALEWFTVKRLRKAYSLIQESMKKGWGLFSLVSALFYLLMLIMMNYPTNILDRPSGIPAMLLVLILMPLMYFNIFQILTHHQKLYAVKEQKDILDLERGHLEDIIKNNAAIEDRIRIERHDLRHRMKSILAMLENREYDEAIEYIRASTQFFYTNKTERYCQNPILDAVFSAYFSEAANHNIKVESSLAIPNDLPVDPIEFSIVFANALENAIHACQKLPESERIIKCKYVIRPKHMCQISNPFVGDVTFDEKGRPLSLESEHGIGTRSIIAFCDKYNAVLNYKVKDGWFYLRIIL